MWLRDRAVHSLSLGPKDSMTAVHRGPGGLHVLFVWPPAIEVERLAHVN